MADNNVTITRVTKFRINLYAHYLLAKPNPYIISQPDNSPNSEST